MKTHTFKGGIHPPEKKELSESFPIEQLSPLPKTVTIPVTMGGAPNAPLVKPGEEVARGQVLSASEHPMSAPVHSSVAGVVKKIETRVLTGGAEGPCFIIEPNDSGKTDFMPPLDPFSCSKEEAIKRVRSAGIVGMGGAAFPTAVKLSPPPGKKIDSVIVNGAECEPYLTIDCRVMEEMPAKIVDGAVIAAQIVGAERVYIATESNKLHLVPILEKAVQDAGRGDKVSVVVCK
ncbi:MAG: electron transport complex subunit RsxC, partial [Spirochaetaceae bacterium]|nr:electron transport complex subunit RsxC [Spirochaetaceae bacterium]